MKTYQKYVKQGIRLFPYEVKELYALVDSLKSENAELKDKLNKMAHKESDLFQQNLDEIAELKDKLHRRNMLANHRLNRIKGLIKLVREYKEEIYRLSALLGRLGYDLKGNKQ